MSFFNLTLYANNYEYKNYLKWRISFRFSDEMRIFAY